MKLVELEYIDQDLPQGWKPYTIYEIIVEGQAVGKLTLREGNRQERFYDGHIGYSIDEQYRGHYYSYYACLEILTIAKDKGYQELVITCSPDNHASQKIIQRLDSEYLGRFLIPKDQKRNFDKKETHKDIYVVYL